MSAVRPTAREIIEDIAARYGFSRADILSPSMRRPLVAARQHAMFEVRRLRPDMSLPQMGRIFQRDHTTCLHGIRVWPKKAKKMGRRL